MYVYPQLATLLLLRKPLFYSAISGSLQGPTTVQQESATVGDCISADGWKLPALIILQGKTVQEPWLQARIPNNYILAATESAYVNDEIFWE